MAKTSSATSFIFPYNSLTVMFATISLRFPLNSFQEGPCLSFPHLLSHGSLDPWITQCQLLTTLTTCSSLIWPSAIKRAAVLSINSSVLILFLIQKVITSFLYYSKLTSRPLILSPKHQTCHFHKGWASTVKIIRNLYVNI